jgi:cell division protein FtsW (lipid II flippase)
MRVVVAEPARPARARVLPQPDRDQRRLARLECLALIVTTAVLALGFWISYRQQSAGMPDMLRAIERGAIVDLSTAARGHDLANVLTVKPSGAERSAAARAVLRSLETNGPLTHVGALASLTMPGSRVKVFTPADIAAIKPAIIVRTPAMYTRGIAITVVLFLLSFWLAHFVRRLFNATGDPVLLPSMQMLTGLALLAMMSIRDPLRDTDAAWSIAIGVAIGCALLIVCSFVDFEKPVLRSSTLAPLGLAVLLAVALLVFGGGPGGSGAKVNLLGVQPIEVIRMLAVFALASFFSRRWEFLRELSHSRKVPRSVRRFVRVPRWRDVSPVAIIVGTLLTFFFLQRDLGPALVLGCMALALYGVARGSAVLVIAGFLLLVAGFAAGYALGFPATVAQRVAIWMNPWNNVVSGGDQVAHGLWALSSGGPWGLGLGLGDGQLVPAGHTDLIVPVIGEEIGFAGVLAVAAIYALLIGRMLSVAARASGDYTAFLALGCALSLAVPALVIAGGVLGLLPLSGLVTPFLSFGKSSMTCNFAAVAIVLSIARRARVERVHLSGQMRTVAGALGLAAVVVVGSLARVQAVAADDIVVKPTLVVQADGVARYQYNPRLLQAARRIARGTIFDRNGFALATGESSRAEPLQRRLAQLGAADSVACPPAPARCYPLGAAGFHLIGESARQTNWAAPNVAFAERDENATLQGFDDRPRIIQPAAARGTTSSVVVRDYHALLPLVRHKGDPSHPDVQRLLQQPRDVTVTIDGPLQSLISRALARHVVAAGATRGAAVVVDVDTGGLLAAASYPSPDFDGLRGLAPDIAPPALLDRVRFGLYPPGSTFKLITAAAALSRFPEQALPAFRCEHLAGGRVGARIRGVGRPIRDDVLDHVPHGLVTLREGLVVSCNAYFAQLALHVGADALIEASELTGVQIASAPVRERLRRTLPYAGYGQGEVLVSPLRMARVAAAIASGGIIREAPLRMPTADGEEVGDGRGTTSRRWLSAANADLLARTMRQVVVEGTGRSLAGHPTTIAGKTGTAEVNGAPSHSWFVGFAPFEGRTGRIAFAVIVENAGYGGRVAAPLAGDVVKAAEAAGVIR